MDFLFLQDSLTIPAERKTGKTDGTKLPLGSTTLHLSEGKGETLKTPEALLANQPGQKTFLPKGGIGCVPAAKAALHLFFLDSFLLSRDTSARFLRRKYSHFLEAVPKFRFSRQKTSPFYLHPSEKPDKNGTFDNWGWRGRIGR
jgi:hypothetical protein